MTSQSSNKKDTDKSKQASKEINVVVITHFYGAHGGGIELVAERLITEIAKKKKHVFTWVASDCDPAPIIEGQTMMPMRTMTFLEKVLGVAWPLWGWKSLRNMKRAIKEADCIWLHDTLYLGNILAFRYARAFGKPVVITQHIAPIHYKNPLTRFLMRFADSLFTCKMMEQANEVTFISDRVADDYYKRVAFTRPIKVIPNGVDTRLFNLPIAENRRFLRQQFALKNEQPVFLFVGRFIERKGLDVLRLMAKMHPEWRFWLAGQGPIDPESWMLPNIHVFRNRRGLQLAELYQSADLLLMPSHGEGFPLVIQEAFACGLPVLCSHETAHGSELATPHLQTAPIWPEDPAESARSWMDKIVKMPVALPLEKPSEELAEFAYTMWNWKPIAGVYANILTAHTK